MGMPFGRLICASNCNNILTDFINTDVYDRNRDFYTTISPSMDILISSNLERLLYLLAGPERCAGYMKALNENGKYEVEKDVLEKIKESFCADFCSEEDTAITIRETFETYSYLIDTHTACALYASINAEKKNAEEGRNVKIITASTASPYKFAADVLRSLGKEPDSANFEVIYELSKLTETEIPAPLAALANAQIRFTDSVGKTAEDMLGAALKFVGIND
jgi:threonine synthase